MRRLLSCTQSQALYFRELDLGARAQGKRAVEERDAGQQGGVEEAEVVHIWGSQCGES